MLFVCAYAKISNGPRAGRKFAKLEEKPHSRRNKQLMAYASAFLVEK